MRLFLFLLLFTLSLLGKPLTLDSQNILIYNQAYLLKKDIPINEAIKSKEFQRAKMLFIDIYEMPISNYWLKISLKNEQQKRLFKSLVFFWDRAVLDIYYVKQNSVQKLEKLNDSKKRVNYLRSDFTLEKNSTLDIYVKVSKKSKPYFINGVYLVDTQKVEKFILHESTLFNNGFFAGILHAIVFYSLILFVSTRLKMHLYFCLFILCTQFMFTSIQFDIGEWFGIEPNLLKDLNTLTIITIQVSAFAFYTKEFFQTAKKHKIINSLINYTIIATIATLIVNLFIIKLFAAIYIMFFLIPFIFIGFYLIKTHKDIALLYSLGTIFLCCYFFCITITIFFDINLSSNFFFILKVTHLIYIILFGLSAYISINTLAQKQALQEKQLLQKSKFTAMGEMIGNIAHQWRQPLNNVSTALANIEVKSELNLLTHQQLKTKIDEATTQLNYMSETIDDFLNFFSKRKELTSFNLLDAVNSALVLMKISLKKEKIEVFINNKDCFVKAYKNELIQVLTIILTNAKDALKQKENKQISITIKDNCIYIEDNAGGIKEEIIDKIFNPYFSTKHSKNGNGLGLYTAKRIIEENMKGELLVENSTKGAKFIIKLKD